MKFTEPKVSAHGLFMVLWKENYPHWLAWTEWRRDALDRSMALEKLSVPFAWPPITSHGVQMVVDGLKAIAKSSERDKPPSQFRSVPEFPPPWREWSASTKQAVVHKEAERRGTLEFGGDFIDWQMARRIKRNLAA